MPDGEVSRDVLRPAVVPRVRLRAAGITRRHLAGQMFIRRLLDGDRQRKAKTMTNDRLITCTCGSTLAEDTRQPVGPMSARGAACDQHAQVKAGRPTESKMGRAVETK